jgi:uncharacterized protein YkwD
MLHIRGVRILLALLTVVSVSLIGTYFAQAAPPTPTHIYLPLVNCPTCRGGGVVVPTATAIPTATPAPSDPEREMENEVIRLINIERVAAGCPAATPHPILMQATRDWSAYMERTSDYRHSQWGYYQSYGWPRGALENLGGGPNAAWIVEGWMESPLHRRNLLSCYKPGEPSYSPTIQYWIGVGIAQVGGYATMALDSYTFPTPTPTR